MKSKGFILTIAAAVGGNDQVLLAWALRTGRLDFALKAGTITTADIAHDDGCLRPLNRGQCKCRPHIKSGMTLVRWSDYLFSTVGGQS